MYPIQAIRSFAVWRPVECVHPPPQAGALFLLLPRNCHSAGGLLETRVPLYAPPTCEGSDPQTQFTARIRRASSSRYHLEIATAPAGSTRPRAQPSARRPPAAHGGSVIAGPRGARHPPAHTQASRGRVGADPACSQSRHAPPRETPAASRPPRLSQGPMVCYSCRPLTHWQRALPHHTIHADPRVAPYSMFWHNARLRKRGDILGGEETPPRTHLAATAPRFSPVCAPLLAKFFHFLTDISV